MFQLKNTEILFIALFALVGWVIFLFVDASKVPSDIQMTHNVARDISFSGTNSTGVDSVNIPEIATEVVYEEAILAEIQESVTETYNITAPQLEGIQLKYFQGPNKSRVFEDIKILSEMYKNYKDLLVLKVLIDKLYQDFQFDEAKTYAETLVAQDGLQALDPHMYIQIVRNSSDISVVKESSVETVRTLLENQQKAGLLAVEDYRFYQSLLYLRYGDKKSARDLQKNLITPRYASFVAEQQRIFTEIAKQKDIPEYYQDALISLNLLKHGHFALAKKMALDVVKQDKEYILPYQVLAYSHFLSNNWEKSVDYLFRLVDLDKYNKDLYAFLIGVSYHWMGKYEQSIIQLTQIEKSVLNEEERTFDPKLVLSDAYRYMLLNYEYMQDEERMILVRKKLLGQPDISKTDFYHLFYEYFFSPYVAGDKLSLYASAPGLVEDYLESCVTLLPKGEREVCQYGMAGLQIAHGAYEEAKNQLLFLAKEYPQSYLFHSLGDLYVQEKDPEKAKQYYIKAIALSPGAYEEQVLKQKIADMMGATVSE